ncbi:Flp pilus assembly protein TadC [Mycobacterium sp. JS623]|uniref:type II secretion system F family protein n=1 Tax=Mycobacterium sp. JS623 TaxID=212767 RepID=UPI0002A5986E|nr:type II secretion system F family protein [Mycobacterium sp. JS623]AGB26132.1 Flp pilus assembly protein TadC [Mycobacterium sp. JS623]
MSWAALLLATALMLGTDSRPRVRAGLRVVRRRSMPARTDDPLAAASSLDVLAACLRSGMAVSTAASATAPSAPAPLAAVLSRAADLLALGAEPSTAWTTVSGSADKNVDALLRLARRSAASGAAMAQGVAELADQSRHDAAAAATAAAERASVLIAGPLGLCYLPAFVCLGIVPVVAGLAGDVLGSGIL